MKTFFQTIIKHISNVVAMVIAYGGAAWLAWWLFDEEIKQASAWLIDVLDRLF